MVILIIILVQSEFILNISKYQNNPQNGTYSYDFDDFFRFFTWFLIDFALLGLRT